MLPQLIAATGLGADATAAFATREGIDPAAFVERSGLALTPDMVGKAVVELTTDRALDRAAYLLTAGGLTAVD